MTDYAKATNFASKDSLSTGNPLKIVKGTEIDTEFNNIATAIATKADLSGATLTGATLTSPTLVTPALGTPASGTMTNVSGTAASLTAGAAQQLTTTNWTVVESGGYIYFKYGGVNKLRLDSSGNVVAAGNITAYGSI